MPSQLDYGILNNQKSLLDQQALQAAFEQKKALEIAQVQALQQKALNGGVDTPSSVAEYEYFNQLAPEQQQQFINVKRANNPLNLGNTFAIRDQLTNQVTPLQGGTINPKLSEQPDFRAAQAAAVSNAQNESDLGYKPQIAAATENAKTIGTSKTNAEIADNTSIPILKRLQGLNERTANVPYLGTAQPFLKVGGSDAATAYDLMKQERLNLAAPLAKQLGVNPTDKDFQSTLDRIFDFSSTKESRAAQINNLLTQAQGRRNNALQPTTNIDAGEQPIRGLPKDSSSTIPELVKGKVYTNSQGQKAMFDGKFLRPVK